MKTEEYLEIMSRQIRCRMARESVSEEIRNHIDDQKAAFLSQGMEKNEAEEAAVREMGDPEETGNALDQIHRPTTPWGMIAFIVVLSGVGYGVQNVLQIRAADNGEMWVSMGRQLLFLVVGIVLMAGVCVADYTRIAQRAREGMILIWAVCVVGMAAGGVPYNGSKQWILVFNMTVNVTMLLMLTVPLYAAVLYRYRGQGYRAIGKGLLWMIPALWIDVICPNMGAAVLLFLSYVIVLGTAVYKEWFVVSKRKVLAGMTGLVAMIPAVFGMGIVFFGTEYQWERLLAILGGSGEMDRYPNRVVQDFLFVSRMIGENADTAELAWNADFMTDFMLTGVAACYGILAAGILAALILFLIVRFFRSSLRQRNQLGMLMGLGCSVFLLMQVVVYMFNNLGITYIACFCPFLTYGGSASLSYIMMGFLLSIFRYQNVAPERKARQRLFRDSRYKIRLERG